MKGWSVQAEHRFVDFFTQIAVLITTYVFPNHIFQVASHFLKGVLIQQSYQTFLFCKNIFQCFQCSEETQELAFDVIFLSACKSCLNSSFHGATFSSKVSVPRQDGLEEVKCIARWDRDHVLSWLLVGNRSGCRLNAILNKIARNDEL
ncbi:MAG: hypothetical protein BRD48_01925 [Bacteroidetes bacterium QS_9_68_14]|nr:MAG: hypothetical protein BRD48_01925 [Bacteroidetes bacterium QS_9_68_14]